MLIIRLQRVGRANDPSFRLVIMESKRSAKSGAFLEILGSYNPKTKKLQLKNEKIKEWIGKGAQVSDTAHNLLVGAKLIDGPKINVVRGKPKAEPVKA